MSLLDEARRLIEPTVEGAYVYCGGLVDEGHREQCNLAAVPEIIAALKAAERFVASSRDEPHDDETAFEALVTTLKDDEEPIP